METIKLLHRINHVNTVIHRQFEQMIEATFWMKLENFWIIINLKIFKFYLPILIAFYSHHLFHRSYITTG